MKRLLILAVLIWTFRGSLYSVWWNTENGISMGKAHVTLIEATV